MSTGYFMDGMIPGLSVRRNGSSRLLEKNGAYEYNEGEYLTFCIGNVPIGTAPAAENITPLDFYMQAGRMQPEYSDFCVLNTARLLLGATAAGPEAMKALGEVWSSLDLLDEPEDFLRQKPVTSWLRAWSVRLPSCAYARNRMRRCEQNIHTEIGVRIPLKDGRTLRCSVFRPIAGDSPCPVVMCMGSFGNGFINGFPEPENAELYEEAEDRFFSEPNRLETQRMLKGVFLKRMLPCVLGSLPLPQWGKNAKTPKAMSPAAKARMQKIGGKMVVGPYLAGKKPSVPMELPKIVPVSSTFESPAPEYWVPKGYVVVLVEEYGQGENPGDFRSFGARNSHDYCEAIEWAAEQPWSSGKVGLFGASYYAMTQFTAAQYHPKGLAAMIPIMGDADSYRDYNYSAGGLYNRADNFDTSYPFQSYTNLEYAMEHPFYDPKDYGPDAPFCCSADMSRIDVPMWALIEPMTGIHTKGTSEAYIRCPSPDKRISVIMGQGIHFWMFNTAMMDRFCAFFDHWLKGQANGDEKRPRAELQIATGNGSYAVRTEEDWPVPGTQYRRLYLAAGGKLAAEPGTDGADRYSADIPYEKAAESGVTYISEPLTEDTDIAGYVKAHLMASSTTSDMELHISLEVLGSDGKQIVYHSPAHIGPLPTVFGALKASHREQDPNLTRPECPVYLHTEEACKKLIPGQITECEVASFPAAFRAPAGSRLVLRVYPVDPAYVAFDAAEFRPGSFNSIAYGAANPSYIQIPVLPADGSAMV